MLLVHDIGEIDTGDTLVFVEGGWEERKAAERAAVTRICGLLPEPVGAAFLALWQEFDRENARGPVRQRGGSGDACPPEPRQPGASWRENGVSYERVVRRIAPQIQGGCPAQWHYLAGRLEEARQHGWFGA